MADWDSREPALPDWVGSARLAIGLAQGIALYLLAEAIVHKSWPTTQPMLNGALWATAAYAPLVAILGLGRLRIWTLGVWLAVAVVSLASLGAYSVWREIGTVLDPNRMESLHTGVVGLRPSPTMAGLGVCLAIVNVLISGADADRRLVGSYTTYFEIAWKQGLQLALSCAFVLGLWGVLVIGGSLFKLVHIDAVDQLVGRESFFALAGSVAFAAGLHLTDSRYNLIRAGRALGLGLLGWLTLVLTALVVAFLAVLPFTGLKPLWDTHQATKLMIGAAAGLIFLINTIDQDGTAERSVVLRITARAGALAVAPLALIAGYAMWLRVDQYGLTGPRVIAAALDLIVVVYAVAYALCALKPKRWMDWLAPVNICLAVFSVAVVLALMTPVADPARLGTADQVDRLENGRIAPDKFDFRALKFKQARYGRAALQGLAGKSGNIGEKARAAQAAASYFGKDWERIRREGPMVMVRLDKGERAPTFALGEEALSDCRDASACQGAWVRFPKEKRARLIVLHQSTPRADLMRQGADGKWRLAGFFWPMCVGDREALLDGVATSLPPSAPGDLNIRGRRVAFSPPVPDNCDKGN